MICLYGDGVKGKKLSVSDMQKKLKSHGRIQLNAGKELKEAKFQNFKQYILKLAKEMGDRDLERDAKNSSKLKKMFDRDLHYKIFTDKEVTSLSGKKLHNMIKYDKRFDEGKLTEDFSQRARNFRVNLRMRMKDLKKGGKIIAYKMTFTKVDNDKYQWKGSQLWDSEAVVKKIKLAAVKDIQKWKHGASGAPMVKAFLTIKEGKVNEVKMTKAHAKILSRLLIKMSVESVIPHKDILFVNYTNYKNRAKIIKAASKLFNYDNDGRMTNAPRGILGVGGTNWIAFKSRHNESVNEATDVWKRFDAMQKLQGEGMDIETDMHNILATIKQLHKNMEQEAEPEGGPKATKYGREIEKYEKMYKKRKAELKKVFAKLDKLEQF